MAERAESKKRERSEVAPVPKKVDVVRLKTELMIALDEIDFALAEYDHNRGSG